MLCSFTSGPISERFGRRFAFTIGGILSVAATAVAYTSGLSNNIETRRGLFLLGKIILGISLSLLISTCQT